MNKFIRHVFNLMSSWWAIFQPSHTSALSFQFLCYQALIHSSFWLQILFFQVFIFFIFPSVCILFLLWSLVSHLLWLLLVGSPCQYHFPLLSPWSPGGSHFSCIHSLSLCSPVSAFDSPTLVTCHCWDILIQFLLCASHGIRCQNVAANCFLHFWCLNV